MSDTVIKVENLSKLYRIGAKEGYKTFRETLIDSAKAPFLVGRDIVKKVIKPFPREAGAPHEENTIWALRNVSFEVKQGEVVGIIGRNGAGKSTLLKILSKITEPTEGRVELRGRVGSLLEVGTGFHPELTGHENVYLYGAILGMDRWEVTRKFDEIIAFAELEKFVDTPVKRYSSGMYMRLAFAVAAHLEPEILLVDEVLAVGDASFQKRCLGKMEDVSKEGRTVLFVSHNMAAVLGLCGVAIMLQEGTIGASGTVSNVVQTYLRSSKQKEKLSLQSRTDRRGSGLVRLCECKLCSDPHGEPISEFLLCDHAHIVLTLDSKAELRIWIGIKIIDAFGRVFFSFNGRQRGFVPLVQKGKSKFILNIRALPLLEGEYTLSFVCSTAGSNDACDDIERVASFTMHSKDLFGSGSPYTSANGLVFIDYDWEGPI
jgi:lipopolysaccharide transport system ATP-binding protein